MYSSRRCWPEGTDARTARSRVASVESVVLSVGAGRSAAIVGRSEGCVVSRVVRSVRSDSFGNDAVHARGQYVPNEASQGHGPSALPRSVEPTAGAWLSAPSLATAVPTLAFLPATLLVRGLLPSSGIACCSSSLSTLALLRRLLDTGLGAGLVLAPLVDPCPHVGLARHAGLLPCALAHAFESPNELAGPRPNPCENDPGCDGSVPNGTWCGPGGGWCGACGERSGCISAAEVGEWRKRSCAGPGGG